MKKAKEFTKEVKEIVKQERKIHVREIGKNEKSYHKYKLSNDYTVQQLLSLICNEMFAKRYGTAEIELFYDVDGPESENPLDVSLKIGKLKFTELIFKKNVEENNASHDANTSTTSAPSITSTESLQRFILLVGRTGSGKSLLGCVLLDKYKEAGFEVSDYGNSCTKAAEFKSSDANKLTVYDTKGFFDAETERDNYLNGTKDQKLQLIKEIMQALESIQNTGVHGIFLVVKRGRIDVKDKEIIDNLGKYVFNDDMKKKVYLVFTNSSMKYCKNKQEGIDWFDKQCQVNDASGFSTHVFSQYRDVIEHKHDRILFVDNKNPDDAVDEEEEAYKIQNKEMAQKIIQTLRSNGDETVSLQSKFKRITEEYNQLIEEYEKAKAANKDKKVEKTEGKIIKLFEKDVSHAIGKGKSSDQDNEPGCASCVQQ